MIKNKKSEFFKPKKDVIETVFLSYLMTLIKPVKPMYFR